MTAPMTCCVPNCPHQGVAGLFAHGCEALCEGHYVMASTTSRKALDRARARLRRLQESWDQNETFEKIAARGRYLQFCALLEAAHDRVDRAWARIKLEALASALLLDPSSASRSERAMSPDVRAGRPARRSEAVPDLLGL